MKIAYLDCASGIAGDMTLAALVDAGADLAAVQAGIDSLGLPSCRLVTSEVKRRGFRGLALQVEHEPEHKHRHLHHITDMIDRGRLTERQKDIAKRIFTRLGEAEAKVHGTTIQKVHFHEVGAVDSIADIVGTAIAFDLMGIERVVASPVPTGCGFIEIAHGRCSLPAPATAELLAGVPLASSPVQAELTTPTGAAILAALVSEFGPPPAMTIRRIGYGAGQRDLQEQPNLLRVLIGEADETATALEDVEADAVWVLETNLDDATGEAIGYCIEQLWSAGALDVYTTGIQMKKNRPGVTLTVLCPASEVAALERIIFSETTTLGVRRWASQRHKLARRQETVQTPWGPVSGMRASFGGTSRFSPEFEACRAIAKANGVSFREVFDAAMVASQSG
jgi:uncharacterized protein (TIGR00299 family) protein